MKEGWMANASRKISAKEVIADIRAAKSHEALMEKYHLTQSQLQALFAKLVKNGLIKESELNGSKFNQETATGAVRAYNFPAPHPPGPGDPGLERVGIADDIRSGMDDLSLLQKYDLSPGELEKVKESLPPPGQSPRSPGRTTDTGEENKNLGQPALAARDKPQEAPPIKKRSKYQPDRQDILINTDWGVPERAITAEEAKQSNLTLFEGYWVTKEEKRQLSKEKSGYVSVRRIAIFFAAFFLFTVPYALATGIASDVWILVIIVEGLVGLLAADGIYRYKPRGYDLARLICAVEIIGCIAMIGQLGDQPQQRGALGGIAIVLLIFGYIFVRLQVDTIRRIFGKRVIRSFRLS
jgi:hypothetical protein